MEPRYDVSEVETRIEKLWEDSGLFNPDVCIEKGFTKPDAEPFSIVLPPPNVTGTLHIGHAFEDTLQDIAVRYARMQGKRTLWVPGTDHAAIATQSKVEKELLKTEKKSRHDLGREEFLKRVNEFAQTSHDTIVRQVKRMGASLDWTREAYTLDERRNLGVRATFKKMYDLGLIYRGNRVVNWDPKGQTVISDDEVMHEERKAKLYTFRYDKNFPISIATTRLETKFGDTAVAVHPSDERYKQYVGKEFDAVYCGIPIHIKVIADESVEKDFGTGALGVTPAHSMIDWEIADRHGLPLKQIINEYGKMTVEGPVNGMKTEEARTWVAEELKKLGLIEKEEEITQNVSIAERTGAIIEPLPKLQWFVAVNKPFENGSRGTITLKQMMRDAVSSGKVRITPEQFEKVYFHWIDNLRDWCISRQIWFGHRVPVWYKGDEIFVDVDAPAGEGWTQDSDTLDTWFSSGLWPFSTLGWPMGEKSMGFHESLVPMVKKGEKTKTYRLTDKNFIPSQIVPTDNSQTNEKFGFLRIKSVTKKTVAELDPQEAGHEKYKDAADLMATLQGYYPALKVTKESPVWVYEFSYQRTSDLETYFPNTLMAPGYEILPLWVARMILMSGVLLESIPFKTVLIHGIVRDSKGQKFSKSLGNGIDPLILANTYGADALRMGLTVGSAPGNDIKFDEQRIKGYRNFSTKIWNIARFIEMNKPVASSPAPSVTLAEARVRASSDAHQKYLSDIAALKKEVSAHLDNFEFHLAGEKLYHYVWHEFADVVIEAEKETLKNGIDEEKTASYAVLEQLLLESLKMLHPFMPFITEEIYQIFRPGKMLMIEKW